MGLRYRRYIRVAPGIRLNVSKSGLSATLGPRGANINVGKRGAYANLGAPGTGVFDREKLSGPRNNEVGKFPTSTPEAHEVQHDAPEEPEIAIGHVEVHVGVALVVLAITFLAGMAAEVLLFR